MDSPRLMRRLRAAFDARVFNHGDYNLVYGQPSGVGAPLVIGYRHAPLEMVLCRVDPALEPGQGSGSPGGAETAVVGLHNVATVADTGSGYQVETVTGFRTWFEVSEHARVPVGELTEDGTAALDQTADAAGFHAFMTAFMDELDRLYGVGSSAADPAPETDPAADLDPPGNPW